MTLQPRTVLVTGASRGLGLEYVRQLLTLPHPPEVLIATCRDPANASELQTLAQRHDSLSVVRLDVQKPEDIDSAYKESEGLLDGKGLNLLINNAGVYKMTPPSDLQMVQREEMNFHFDVNCTGPLMVTQKFLPLVEKAADPGTKLLSCSQAAVAFTGSSMGSLTHTTMALDGRNSFTYRCSKAALSMAILMTSFEATPLGILVLAVHPGWVQTDMGGANAPDKVSDSVASILAVLGRAGSEHAGRTLTMDGDIFPF